MAEIVNLKQVRRARARAEREKEAEANRLKFGRTKVEAEKKRLEETRAERAHEAHKLDDESE
jgi:hypothetical protein